MQQRRVRLGDILDDYCPRERRVTNHVVVAMIDDEVKQTRCSTCDADHEYKHAKVPAQRRKKGDEPAVPADVPFQPIEAASVPDDMSAAESAAPDALEPPADAGESDAEPADGAAEEEGPVHRRLIRATLPRPEGQVPERREPEFTMRQPGFRGRSFDNANGQRPGRRPGRPPGGGGSSFGYPGQPPRQGSGQGPRHGSGQAPRHGSGQGSGGPGFRQSGNRPGPPGGGPRGPRHGGGGRGGRKRGR